MERGYAYSTDFIIRERRGDMQGGIAVDEKSSARIDAILFCGFEDRCAKQKKNFRRISEVLMAFPTDLDTETFLSKNAPVIFELTIKNDN